MGTSSITTSWSPGDADDRTEQKNPSAHAVSGMGPSPDPMSRPELDSTIRGHGRDRGGLDPNHGAGKRSIGAHNVP